MIKPRTQKIVSAFREPIDFRSVQFSTDEATARERRRVCVLKSLLNDLKFYVFPAAHCYVIFTNLLQTFNTSITCEQIHSH